MNKQESIPANVNRRTFLKRSGAAAAALSLAGPAPAAKPESNRPNLVYVFADQLRYQSCGYAGDDRAHTPTIDRLAAEGCNFRNAVATAPKNTSTNRSPSPT